LANLYVISREKDSHKGENGKVAVIGGSVDYTGAPALSAQAALRTGSDLTKVVTSEEAKEVVEGYSENLIVGSYPSAYLGLSGVENCLKVIYWSDVAVIGPGLGDPGSEAVQEILEKTKTPIVVDADAIKPALEVHISNAVFMPHTGEAELIREKFGSIEKFVDGREDIVVLEKGSKDKIYFEEGFEDVSAGHPGMTVGGTGDVLTGIVAGMMAQELDKKEAAVKAAKVNGKAGEKAAEKYGNGLLATDLIENIPDFL
jgi:NAD(P)H-hydrate epimerase